MSTLTDIDLSDLDMLDDTLRHGYCTACNGDEFPLGTPFVALCGIKAVHLTRWEHPEAFPPDACPKCVELWDRPCRRCGA